jgi:hypothetical protein
MTTTQWKFGLAVEPSDFTIIGSQLNKALKHFEDIVKQVLGTQKRSKLWDYKDALLYQNRFVFEAQYIGTKDKFDENLEEVEKMLDKRMSGSKKGYQAGNMKFIINFEGRKRKGRPLVSDAPSKETTKISKPTSPRSKGPTLKELRADPNYPKIKGRSTMNKEQLIAELEKLKSGPSKPKSKSPPKPKSPVKKSKSPPKQKSSMKAPPTPGKTCTAQSTKKYQGRTSPPYPANAEGCRDSKKYGQGANKDVLYESRPDKRGVYRWYKVGEKKR